MVKRRITHSQQKAEYYRLHFPDFWAMTSDRLRGLVHKYYRQAKTIGLSNHMYENIVHRAQAMEEIIKIKENIDEPKKDTSRCSA